jgi:hypothetical protein
LKAIKYVSGCVKGCGAVCVKILELVLVAEVNIENICLFFVNFSFFLCHRATITAMICGWCSGGQSQMLPPICFSLIRNSLMVLIAKCVDKANHCNLMGMQNAWTMIVHVRRRPHH